MGISPAAILAGVAGVVAVIVMARTRTLRRSREEQKRGLDLETRR
jgi:ammonia channel protein AmtB